MPHNPNTMQYAFKASDGEATINIIYMLYRARQHPKHHSKSHHVVSYI